MVPARNPRDPAVVFLVTLPLAAAAGLAVALWGVAHSWQPRADGYPALSLAVIIFACSVFWLRDARGQVRPLRGQLIAAAAARQTPEVWANPDARLLLGVQRGTRLKVPTWFIWRIPDGIPGGYDQEGIFREAIQDTEVSSMYDVFAFYPNSLRVHRGQGGLVMFRDAGGRMSQRVINLEQGPLARWQAWRLRRSLGTLYATPPELRLLLGQLTAAEPLYRGRGPS